MTSERSSSSSSSSRKGSANLVVFFLDLDLDIVGEVGKFFLVLIVDRVFGLVLFGVLEADEFGRRLVLFLDFLLGLDLFVLDHLGLGAFLAGAHRRYFHEEGKRVDLPV